MRSFSSHNIEHLYPHEAPVALGEFRRVLKDDGFVVITCPDMASIAAYIANNGLDSIAYMSGMGPITPLDMIFGHNAPFEMAMSIWHIALPLPE